MSGITHRFIQTNGINMHIAEAGAGPIILLIHGFPDLWYSWRYQIPQLANAGFHVVAPDVRGFGQTDAPLDPEQYTALHLTGDLIGLLDALGEEKVFVVGHDWGAEAAWTLCLLRPDRFKAVVCLSVSYSPRLAKGSLLKLQGERLGKQWYMSKFQEKGSEQDIIRGGLSKFLKGSFLSSSTKPLMIPEGKNISDAFEDPGPFFPSWFTEEDLKYYTDNFERSGLTGPINVYRAINRTWELLATWTKAKIYTPALFISGSRDVVWHVPGTKKFVEGGALKHFVPNLEGHILLDSGHFIHQEKHEEVTKLLINFFRQHLNHSRI